MSKILIADDEESIRTVLRQTLVAKGHEIRCVDDGLKAEVALQQGGFDLAILDIRMPGQTGLELLAKSSQFMGKPSILVITAQDTMENAVSAMKCGAYDYLTKPFDLDEVLLVVERALETRSLKAEIRELKKPMKSSGQLLGRSKAMQAIFKTIGRIANQDLTVLLQGESGTGKELVAKAIHFQGDRAGQNFVAVNCSAIPENLLESELFGVKKGAFTGAHEDKQGYFEQADHGTLFLDEIGEMGLPLQSKLLRVLQEKEIQRLGDSKIKSVDVRVIAATNRDLRLLVKQGRFREDLFFRLNVVPIHIPPLRERREDIPVLVDFFMKRIAQEVNLPSKFVTAEAMEFLKEAPWPGNIRELENLLKRVFVLSQGDKCDLIHFTSLSYDAQNTPWEAHDHQGLEALIEASLQTQLLGMSAKELKNLYEKYLPLIERPLVKLGLKLKQGNQIQTAAILGINRNTLRKKIRELKIDRRGLLDD